MATEFEIKPKVVIPPIDEPINQFKALKKELKDAIGELAGLEAGTADYVKQAEKVGKIKDQINDLNDAIKQTSGAPIENLTNSFGLLSGQISNLDFEGATNSLKQFGASLGQVKVGDITKQAKEFGKTLVTVGKELVTIGKSLLTNPLFIFPAILVAIIAGLVALKDRIAPIRILFEAVGDAVMFIISPVTRLLEILGVIADEAEKNSYRVIKATNEELNAIQRRYDFEIALARATRRTTAQLELDKLADLKARAEATVQELDKLKEKFGALNEEDKKSYKEAQDKIVEYAQQTTILLEIENQKRLDFMRSVTQIVTQANINAIKNDRERELAAVAEAKKTRLKAIEQQYKEIGLTKEGYQSLRDARVAIELDATTQVNNINKKYYEEELKRIEAVKKANQDAVDNANEIAKKVRDKQIEDVAKANEDRAKAKEQAKDDLAKETAELYQQEEDVSLQFNESQEKRRLQIAATKAAELEAQAAKFSAALQTTDALSGLNDFLYEQRTKDLEEGSKEEIEAAKKRFNINKGLQLVNAGIQGTQAVLAAYASTAAIPVVGAALAPAAAAIAGVAAAVNIAKIASAKFEPSASGGSSTKPSVSSGGGSGDRSASVSPNGAAFSNNFSNGNVTSTNPNTPTNSQPNVSQVVLVESDVTKVVKRVSVIETQAKFP